MEKICVKITQAVPPRKWILNWILAYINWKSGSSTMWTRGIKKQTKSVFCPVEGRLNHRRMIQCGWLWAGKDLIPAIENHAVNCKLIIRGQIDVLTMFWQLSYDNHQSSQPSVSQLNVSGLWQTIDCMIEKPILTKWESLNPVWVELPVIWTLSYNYQMNTSKSSGSWLVRASLVSTLHFSCPTAKSSLGTRLG